MGTALNLARGHHGVVAAGVLAVAVVADVLAAGVVFAGVLAVAVVLAGVLALALPELLKPP